MINFNLWSNSVAIIALIIIAPIFSIFYYAILGDTSLWPHLFSTVLPRYLTNTIILMFGVGGLSLVFGVTTAWIVTRYNFFGKKFFEWMLLLPAAVPAYIIAYTYTDFFEYAGPLPKITAISGEVLFVISKNFFAEGNIKDSLGQKNLEVILRA